MAAFAKEFTDPIEIVLLVSAERTQTWRNADSAWVRGVEFDGRGQLDVVHPALADLYVSGNLTLLRSRVQLPANSGTQTRDIRPLQGQSPYVVNLEVGWQSADSRVFATVAFNVFGPRIVAAGSDGQPDTYERPSHQLDAVLKVPLTQAVSVTAKLDTLRLRRARTASVKLAWTPPVGGD